MGSTTKVTITRPKIGPHTILCLINSETGALERRVELGSKVVEAARVENSKIGPGTVLCLNNAENGELEHRVEVGLDPKPREPLFVENPKGGRANVLLVLQDAATGRVERVVEAKNIVTTSGNQYYAEKSAGQTPAMTFNKGKLTIASSYKSTETNTRTYGDFVLTTFNGTQSFDSGYPKTSDTDTDNTGSGATVVTYRRTYTTSQGNITIKALGVSRFGATTTAAVSLRKLLNYITLSSAQFVTKTSSQTLKAFINHTFLGS